MEITELIGKGLNFWKTEIIDDNDVYITITVDDLMFYKYY
jgi:hypothetical protein